MTDSHLDTLLDRWRIVMWRNGPGDGSTYCRAERVESGEVVDYGTGKGGSVELAVLDLVDRLRRASFERGLADAKAGRLVPLDQDTTSWPETLTPTENAG